MRNKPQADAVHTKKLLVENSVELNTGPAMDALIEKIGDVQVVLLGEASHGTHEYYTWRSLISKRLIEEKNFSFIAVEGDWPDCYTLNRCIKNYPGACPDVETALKAFDRWPTWMWANWEIVALARWMQTYNRERPKESKIGFYGLDVYSLWESLETILKFLEKKGPEAKSTALEAIKCFGPYRHDEGLSYARTARFVPAPCENEVVDLLVHMRKNAMKYTHDHEEAFNVEQNAWVVAGAENYYRTMLVAGPESWNIRDRHMVDTLNRLMQLYGRNSKAIVWEHNTHIGDARATDMWRDGMINTGQLIREQYGEKNVYTVGFGSWSGTVIAADQWGRPPTIMEVPPARQGSWENLLHGLANGERTNASDRLVFMNRKMQADLGKEHLPHRAIGVTYSPRYERFLNYVPSRMPYRYDAFIYIDQTQALHPLHVKPDPGQVPETFPFGL
ncbi:MAG TPA: erythromycin esterase family protein [Flavobacteriales bacterium]|nr:erythromycin esterase family protein [Flavobacteriales bacterium]